MELLSWYTLLIAGLLIIGETLVVLRGGKYWPLSADDYVACGLLLYCALTLDTPLSRLLMLITWGFMAGNLYAMLFTRMDPDGGSRLRLKQLFIIMMLSVVGTVWTLTTLLPESI